MGKHLLVALFGLAFFGAVAVYWQRGEQRARSVPGAGDTEKHSRMSVEEFVIYEYKDHHATGTFQGKLAQFQDPDMLEIFGNVRGSRVIDGEKEFVASEAAALRFSSKGLSELVKNSKLETVTLENQVRFGSADVTMFTDYAKYSADTGKMVSDRPVRMQTSQGDMLGHKGFEYDSSTQNVKVFGPMEGTVVDVER